MKDEIKEINIPENVLVALSDLTNGALNYYKATETVKVRQNTILNCITNLQEERDRTLGALNDLHSLYHYKFNKILEQIKIVEDADLSEHNFCKFIDKVKNIIQGTDKE